MEKKYEYNLDPWYVYNAKITRVVDGDTVDAIIDLGFGMSTKQRLRIDDFDAPESWRPRNEAEKIHGEAAKARAKELLEGKDVIVNTSKAVGIYGRYGASITLDGVNYREIMINEGLEKRESYEETIVS